MSLSITQLDADLAFMVSDLPDSITIDAPDGRTFACSATETAKAKRLQEEGFLAEYDISFTLRSSLLINLAGVAEDIQLRSKLTHAASGLRFRIDKMTESADGVAVRLDCVQVTS